MPEHPLRTLAKDIRALVESNPAHSQVCEFAFMFCDYCQLIAGFNEGLHREAKLSLIMDHLEKIIFSEETDSEKIRQLQILLKS